MTTQMHMRAQRRVQTVLFLLLAACGFFLLRAVFFLIDELSYVFLDRFVGTPPLLAVLALSLVLAAVVRRLVFGDLKSAFAHGAPEDTEGALRRQRTLSHFLFLVVTLLCFLAFYALIALSPVMLWSSSLAWVAVPIVMYPVNLIVSALLGNFFSKKLMASIKRAYAEE